MALRPLHDLIAAHVLAAKRLHARHAGAGFGQGQDRHPAAMGLCPR